MSNDSDNLWYQTIGYGYRGPKRSYLTDEQNCRLERMRIARMLWKGQHRRCFLDERRTQFDFKAAMIQGVNVRPYLTLNILRLITTTVTDLLLGEKPLFRVNVEDADDPLPGSDQASLEALEDRSDLHRVFYDAVKAASWSSEGFVEVVRWGGDVYVQDVRSDEVFPVGSRQPDGQYPSYVRYATDCNGSTQLLLQSTYLPGKITRQCFKMNDNVKEDAVTLDMWPTKRADGTPLLPEESTGIDCNTMTWVANEIDEGNPVSDYDGLIGLQDELNAKQTQIALVIAKHADPKLAAPEASADPSGNLQSNHEVFFYRSKDEVPSYITWNAELAAAIEDRDFTLNALCIAAELSQGLLGLERGATPDSARKLRLQATKSLARAKRKAAFVKPFIRSAIMTALKMEQAGKRVQLALPAPPAVELRDGLPVDELDQAQTINMLTGGKPTMSVQRAVEIQISDPAAAAIELQRLKDDAASATPPIVIGHAGIQPDADNVPQGSDATANSQYPNASSENATVAMTATEAAP